MAELRRRDAAGGDTRPWLAVQPEVHSMAQTIRRHGPAARFFGDEAAQAELVSGFDALHERMLSARSGDPSTAVNEDEGDAFAPEEAPVTLREALAPFLHIMRAPECSSAIVGTCLGSLSRMIRTGVFHAGDSESAHMLSRVVQSVCRARFDAPSGDLSTDEVALHRLVDVLLLALSVDVVVSDVDACLIVETLFSLAALPRAGDLFRRHAELSCVTACNVIFAAGLSLPAESGLIEEDDLPRIAYPGTRGDYTPHPRKPAAVAEAEARLAAEALTVGDVPISPISEKTDVSDVHFVAVPRPFGMAAAVAVAKHLLRLLDVDEERNTDRLRSVALVVFSDVLERHRSAILEMARASGDKRRQHDLWTLVSERYARVLLQLVHAESPTLSVHVHQAVCALFWRYRGVLVAQVEMLLGAIATQLRTHTDATTAPVAAAGAAPVKRTARVPRSFYMELLAPLATDGDALRDVYARCELSPRFGTALADVFGALAAIASERPLQGAASPGQPGRAPSDVRAALSLLVQIVSSLRAIDAGDDESIVSLRGRISSLRATKAALHEAARSFNAGKAKDALAFLQTHGLLPQEPSAENIAAFLHRSAALLDKRALGEYLAKEAHAPVLRAFLAGFCFSGMEIEDALRHLLEAFYLPGEGQQISRVLEPFAETYYATSAAAEAGGGPPAVFRSHEAVHVMAYSIMMLNTDQHNRNIAPSRRMTLEAFVRNNRGLNDGQSYDEAFLRRIYDGIRTREIVMPEDAPAPASRVSAYAWNELLKKDVCFGLGDDTQVAPGEPIGAALANALSAELASDLFDPVLQTFRSTILAPVGEDASIVAARGMRALSGVAGVSGAQLTKLLAVLAECVSFREICAADGGSLLARYLAGSSLFRALVSALFAVFRTRGRDLAADDWRVLVQHVLMLAQSGIASTAVVFDRDDAFAGVADDVSEAAAVGVSPAVSSASLGAESRVAHMPIVGALLAARARVAASASRTPAATSSTSTGFGILSTLGQLLGGGSSASVAVSATQQGAFVSAADRETRSAASTFVRSSLAIDRIFVHTTKRLDDAGLVALTAALCAELRVHRPAVWGVDALAFVADLAVVAAWANRARMSAFWAPLFERLADVARDPGTPDVLREHVVLGLGQLSLRVATLPETQAAVVHFFQLLCHVPAESFAAIAEPALSTVMRIVAMDPPFLHTSGGDIWPHYFSVLALAGRSRSCGPYAFSLLTTLVREPGAGGVLFPLAFFAEYVDLLSGFVAAVGKDAVYGAGRRSGSLLDVGAVDTLDTPDAAAARAAADIAGDDGPSDLAVRALHTLVRLERNVRPAVPMHAPWDERVLPVHAALAQQTLHPMAAVRHAALTLLQRTLLATDYASSGTSDGGAAPEGAACLAEEYAQVLLPLLEELQQPKALLARLHVTDLDSGAAAVEELQVRASSIACRVLLANTGVLRASPDAVAASIVPPVVARILGLLETPLAGDALRESVRETLKNVLLVLTSDDVMSGRTSLWDAVWPLVDAALPTLRGEIALLTPRSAMSADVHVSGVNDGAGHVETADESVDCSVQPVTDAVDGEVQPAESTLPFAGRVEVQGEQMNGGDPSPVDEADCRNAATDSIPNLATHDASGAASAGAHAETSAPSTCSGEMAAAIAAGSAFFAEVGAHGHRTDLDAVDVDAPASESSPPIAVGGAVDV